MLEIEGILNIWYELVTAYHQINGFGGNIAEIYFYHVITKSMELNRISETEYQKKDIEKIHLIFYNIFDFFRKKFDCKLFINEKEFDLWFLEDNNTHRMHVKVIA